MCKGLGLKDLIVRIVIVWKTSIVACAKKTAMMTLFKDLIKENLPSFEDIEGNPQAYSAADPMEQSENEKRSIVVIKH